MSSVTGSVNRVEPCLICRNPRTSWAVRAPADTWSRSVGWGRGASYRYCAKCTGLTLVPRMNDVEYRRFYSELQRSSATGYSDDGVPADHLQRKEVATRVKLECFERLGLANVVPPGSSVFEVGPAEGTLLATFRDRGDRVAGIEPLDSYAEYARNVFGLDVATGYFDAGTATEEAPDLLILDNVLEHMQDPVATLDTVRALLREGGAVLVLVPNAETPEVTNANVAHCTLWSRRALMMALQEAGFTLVGVVPGRPAARPHEWIALAVAGRADHDDLPPGPSLWSTRSAWLAAELFPPSRKKKLATALGPVYRRPATWIRRRLRRNEPGR